MIRKRMERKLSTTLTLRSMRKVEDRLNKIPYLIIFTDCKDCPPEEVKEYVVMPSGDIVVRTEVGESFWFNSEGRHQKSYLLFKNLDFDESKVTRKPSFLKKLYYTFFRRGRG